MCSSFSNFSWIILSGSPSNCLKRSSKSFKNIEKRKGNKFSPCRTPVRQGEKNQIDYHYIEHKT